MAELQLDAHKTALVLIDLQNAIVGMSTAPHPAAQVVANSAKLAEAFRGHGAPVVYVRVDLNDFLQLPVDQPINLGNAPLPGIVSGDCPFRRISAGRHPAYETSLCGALFAGTDLEQQLKSRGVDTVVLTGISTNAGVESTARQGTTASALASSLSLKTPAPVRMVNSIVSHSRRYSLASVACARPMRSSPYLPDTKNQLDRLDPRVWKITAVAVLGSLMGQVDATVVNVSLSSLAVDLHSSLTTIQWVTSGYLLALALMLPLNGWLVGQLGAKSLYLWCFPIFTLSSALCGLAWSANSLIGFRVLQGMSGGLMAPLAQLMIVRAAGRHVARVYSYAAIPILLGPLLGPTCLLGRFFNMGPGVGCS